MTLAEFYEKVGGNYESMQSRMVTDERILKFLKMFPEDPSFDELKSSMATKDAQTAFRAAHTLHGLALNLGLGTFEVSSKQLTENLRGGQFQDNSEALYADVERDYNTIMTALKELL